MSGSVSSRVVLGCSSSRREAETEVVFSGFELGAVILVLRGSTWNT